MGSLAQKLLAKARSKIVEIEGVGAVLVRQPSALYALELARHAKSDNVDFVRLLIENRELIARLVISCVRDPEHPNDVALTAEDVEQLSNEAFTPLLQALVELIQVPENSEVKA